MQRDRSAEIKVGLFVLLALAGFVTMVIVLGSEDSLFEKTYTLQTKFGDAGGLRTGAAVFVAGMDCGLVSTVAFPEKLEQKHIDVELTIRQSCRERVRGDSIATISSQGLLGDKLIAISIGSESRPVLEEGSWIDSEDPAELSYYIDNGKEIVDKAKSIVRKIDDALGTEDAEGAGKSVLAIIQSIRDILADVEKGKGLVHALVYDEASTKRLKSALASVDAATDDIASITKAIKDGDGTIHDLIYEDELTEDLKKLITNLGAASEKIDAVVAEVQTGDGLIHDLVYTDEGQSVLADLKDVSSDIKDMVAMVKRGEGTIGGLIVDPTIYQDVKTLLGKAQRNKILKAYVRDALRRNEQTEGVSEAGLTE